MKNDCGIYEIVSLSNGKRYVGSAVDIRKRWRQHIRLLRLGRHHSQPLQSAWNKYGEASFDCRLIAKCLPHELLQQEQAEFDRVRPEYNVCPVAGSTLGRSHSVETRQKIAARKTGTKLPPRSKEHREKLSSAHKGRSKPPRVLAKLQEGRAKRIYTEEQKAQVSQSLRDAYRQGRHRRDRPTEYREKISAALKGVSHSEERRALQAAGQRGKKRGPYKTSRGST